MRIGVIGTGAIGGTIAALLDRAGHDVVVTARGEQRAVIAEHGIRLTGAWGTHTARVDAVERLTATPELVFVCTKAQDAAAAIAENLESLSETTVVIVQNGLTGLDEAAAMLPGAECIGALALYAASYTAPGAVTVTTAAKTYIGAGSGPPQPATLRVAAFLDSVMPSSATPNFFGCQWTKLIVNQVNAMPAITGLSVQATIADRALRRIITAGMREAVRIGFAGGVRFGNLQGLSNSVLRLLASAPLGLGQALPLRMARRMGAVPNPGSTLQSVRRGQPTEIDYLNGAVVDAAVALGRAAPVNAGLVRLVHEVEIRGTFTTPEAVVRRFDFKR
jgi:2-dehydropantoate 2-reductase